MSSHENFKGWAHFPDPKKKKIRAVRVAFFFLEAPRNLPKESVSTFVQDHGFFGNPQGKLVGWFSAEAKPHGPLGCERTAFWMQSSSPDLIYETFLWSNYFRDLTPTDFTPKGGWGREIHLFQGNLAGWNIIIWSDFWNKGSIQNAFFLEAFLAPFSVPKSENSGNITKSTQKSTFKKETFICHWHPGVSHPKICHIFPFWIGNGQSHIVKKSPAWEYTKVTKKKSGSQSRYKKLVGCLGGRKKRSFHWLFVWNMVRVGTRYPLAITTLKKRVLFDVQ